MTWPFLHRGTPNGTSSEIIQVPPPFAHKHMIAQLRGTVKLHRLQPKKTKGFVENGLCPKSPQFVPLHAAPCRGRCPHRPASGHQGRPYKRVCCSPQESTSPHRKKAVGACWHISRPGGRCRRGCGKGIRPCQGARTAPWRRREWRPCRTRPPAAATGRWNSSRPSVLPER